MFMLIHSVVIFLSADPHMVFRTSLIFLGFMRFGANETHETIVCFFSTDVFLWQRAGRGHAFPIQTTKARHSRYVELLSSVSDPKRQTPVKKEDGSPLTHVSLTLSFPAGTGLEPQEPLS